jgi:predicted ferric reductase
MLRPPARDASRGRGPRGAPARPPTPAGEEILGMLMTIAIILIVLWALGLVTSYTMGGMIHILLVVAIIVILVRVIQGRKVI